MPPAKLSLKFMLCGEELFVLKVNNTLVIIIK